jgi:hypothetical protein
VLAVIKVKIVVLLKMYNCPQLKIHTVFITPNIAVTGNIVPKHRFYIELLRNVKNSAIIKLKNSIIWKYIHYSLNALGNPKHL